MEESLVRLFHYEIEILSVFGPRGPMRKYACTEGDGESLDLAMTTHCRLA